MQVYPIVDPQQASPRIIPPSPSRPPSRTGRSASEDEWTGDEMFDDNGDLICEEEQQEEEKLMKATEERSQWALRQEARSESSSVPRKSQTIIRLKIPPRTTSTQLSLQPTPPASPVSLTHSCQASFEQKDATDPGPSSPPDSQTQAATQSLLTPPPSPPNPHPR